jgi:hypothetical protein
MVREQTDSDVDSLNRAVACILRRIAHYQLAIGSAIPVDDFNEIAP